ncbi:MAG: arginase family protein [Alphaproteobacteria bacterium]
MAEDGGRDIEAKFRAALARAATGPDRVDRRIKNILHGDVPTFMEAPRLRDTTRADVIVFGLPYEGVKILDPLTFVPATAELQRPIYARSGADLAPDAIRRNSIYYSLDHSGGMFHERERGLRIADHLGVADAGNLPVDHDAPAEETLHAACARIVDAIGDQAVPIIVGGDDTVPYVGVRAAATQRKARLAVLKLDSHFDLSWEPRYWAGSQWARCMEAGCLAPENLAIVGIRGLRNSVAWYETARELGVRFWTMQEIEERGIVEVTRAALAAICAGCDFLYLSLDLDVVDPAFLPAQKYPDPAGLTARETLRALRTAIDEGPPLCGFDMACLGPDFDINGLGAQLAARCAVEVIGGLALKRAEETISV